MCLCDERGHEVVVAFAGSQMERRQPGHTAGVDEGLVCEEGVAYLKKEESSYSQFVFNVGKRVKTSQNSLCFYSTQHHAPKINHKTFPFSLSCISSRTHQLEPVFGRQVECGFTLAVEHIHPGVVVEQRGHYALVPVVSCVEERRPALRRLHVHQLLDLWMDGWMNRRLVERFD